MSAGLSETKTPLVGKLFSSITNLPKSAGSDLSKLSGRVTAKLSGSAKGVATSVVGVTDAATGIVGVGTATAGRLTEALGRGADNVLPLVGEAGRVVNDGVSALSTGAFDGLPGFQVKVSVFSSQVGGGTAFLLKMRSHCRLVFVFEVVFLPFNWCVLLKKYRNSNCIY